MPVGSDAPQSTTFFFALSTLSVVLDKEVPEGINLDCKSVKLDPASSSCRLPADGNQALADGTLGVDNAAAAFQQIPSFDLGRLKQQYEAGLASIVFTLNAADSALKNDGTLTLVAEPASNQELTGSEDCGPWPLDEAGVHQPSPADSWCRDGRKGEQLSTAAWIVDGKLFAHFDALSLPSVLPEGDGGTLFRLSYVELVNVWVTGHFEQGDGATSLRLVDGRIAGRWTTRAIFDQLGNQRSCVGKSLEDTGTRKGRKAVCDLLRDISQHDDPSRPCDAVSTQLQFVAYQLEGSGDANEELLDFADCADGSVPDCDDLRTP